MSTGAICRASFSTFRQYQIFSYFQVKWQFSPNLTLDLGIRHEIYVAPTTAQRAGFSNYDPATNSLILAGVGGHPDNLGVSTPLTNFAPRLGVAYPLTDKTVIRSAFGLSYDPAYPDDKWAFNYPVKQNNAFNAPNSYSAAGSMAAGFPAPLPVTIPETGIIPNAPAQGTRRSGRPPGPRNAGMPSRGRSAPPSSAARRAGRARR